MSAAALFSTNATPFSRNVFNPRSLQRGMRPGGTDQHQLAEARCRFTEWASR